MSTDPGPSAFDWGRRSLWLILAVSATVLMGRAAFGPFRLVLSVSNPINAESILALSVLLLLILYAHRGAPTVNPQAGLTDGATAVALTGICLAAWAWSFWFPFVADDYSHISNGLRATPSYLIHLFTVPAADRFFRPLGLLAYAAEAQMWGKNRIAWHAFSLLLHLANSWLIYILAKDRGYRNWSALAASLFFMLCGSRPEAVTWIAAQFDLWASLFFLLALLSFGRFLKTRDRRWEAAELGALCLALLSKESAYVFPLIAFWMLWMEGVRGKNHLRPLWPPALVTAIVFMYRWRLLHGIGGYQMAGTGTPFFYSVDLFRTSKALLLRLPAVLNFPINWTRQPEWWLTIAMLAAILGLVVFASAKLNRKDLTFALGFMLLTAAPVHQFLLIGPDLEKSRVLYLPSIGFALLLAAGFDALRIRPGAAAACAILLFQAAALEHNLLIWRSVGLLAQRTCEGIARAAESTPHTLSISDLPNVVDGVYFLHTGLRPCVEWAAGRELPDLELANELPTATNPIRPGLVWSDSQRAFVPSEVDGTGQR